MKKLIAIAVSVMSIISVKTKGQSFSPSGAWNYIVPAGTTLSYNTTFSYPFYSMDDPSVNFHLATSLYPQYQKVKVTMSTSGFTLSPWSSSVEMTITIESDSPFCWLDDVGVVAYEDSSTEPIAVFYLADGAWYDPNLIGLPSVTPDTLNFGAVPIGADDSLSFAVGFQLDIDVYSGAIDSVGIYRRFAATNVKYPFFIQDTIGLSYCFKSDRPYFHFQPILVGNYQSTIFLFDSLSLYSIPLVLIGEGVAAGVAENITVEPAMQVYPNPCDQFANIVLPTEGLEQVEIRNALGAIVRSYPNVNSDFTIDASPLPGGIYFIEARAGDAVVTKKLVVIH